MRNFIHFVIITVVILIQGSTHAKDPMSYACCSAYSNMSNDTGCCLCSNSFLNCSSVNSEFKTLSTTDRGQCLFPTTMASGVSIMNTATTGNTVTFEETTPTEFSTTDTTPEVEDEEIFTICVLQCPLGFYEDENRNCQKCDELCKNCTLDGGSVKCLECYYGMNSNNSCCPRGTREKSTGNVTICEEVSTPTEDDGEILPIIIGSAVGGVVVIVILVVVVVCCCRHRRSSGYSQSNDPERGQRTKRPISQLLHDKFKKKKKDSSEGQLPSAEELRRMHPRSYENTATIDHRRIAIGAQQEQDKKGRYIKDPTEKNKKHTEKKINHDEEPQEVYENQSTIDLHKQQSQSQKKKEGPFKKLSKRLKSKKGKDHVHKGKAASQVPAGAPTEEYEEVNPPPPKSDMPTETYEEVAANQADFPQEVYEGAAMSNFDEDLPQEEYTTMDPTTQEPTEEYLPMNIHDMKKKPTKVHKKKTKQGTNNPVFTGETIYENIQGGTINTKNEGLYQNLEPENPNMPEEEYQNYQGPISK